MSKYLGIVFDNQLNWADNKEAVVKKGEEKDYLLRKLKSLSVHEKLLTLFFLLLSKNQSFIESIPTFSFICGKTVSVSRTETAYKRVSIFVPR